ncbi:MAG TPA: hypothetical protein VMU50_08290 [Polyangia bacterium]|nr:hypothetical protein [Polyangia bacterium]
MIRRALVFVSALALVATCASESPPPLVVARRSRVSLDDGPPAPPPAPAPLAPADEPATTTSPPSSPIDAVVQALGVEKSALVWSGTRKSFVVILPRKTGEARARRPAPATIALYSSKGERLGTFRALGAGPIGELRFLGEDRLYYRLPSAPARPAAWRRPAVAPPSLRYAIQPIQQTQPTKPTKTGGGPIACTGRDFVFSPAGDHVAYVGGDSTRHRLYVDGQPVYPRRGATTLRGEPAWANDSLGLAAIESGAHRRLVVLVEFDNPTGDNTWPLPPEAADPSLHVFWAGAGKLVVGPSLTKPVFAASFDREPAPMVSLPPARP